MMTTTSDRAQPDAEVLALPAAEVRSEAELEHASAAAYLDTTPAIQRRPIIPAHLRRGNIGATVAHQAGRHWHAARFHGVRSPLYLVAWLWHSARGGARLTARLFTWWHATGLWALESRAVAAGSSQGHHEALAAHREGKKTRAGRTRIVVAFAVLAVIALAAMALASPWWGWALLGVFLVAVLARHGRPEGRQVIKPAVVAPQFEKLTPDIVVRALGSLQMSGIDRVLREGREITFVSPVTRDGPGWRVAIDLPYGVTSTDVIERREKLASGLRRPLGCVWPEPAGDEHAGRLVLYVSDSPLSKARQPAYPLAKAGSASLFSPIPFGSDQRAKPVTLTLMFANLLIGSIPRMGKTVALRLVLLAAALDPLAELHVWELKGTGDCGPLEQVGHAYGSGADDETLRDCLADLRKLTAELDKRAAVIRSLPREVCPDSKVTPELAAKRGLGLHPVVIAIDEVQEAFASDQAAEFEKCMLALIKRGPALGIMLVLATQRPDTKSLPGAISANVAMRFCLRVMDQVANDMVLGTSAYKKGVNATLIAQADKGVGWAVGFADEAQVVKTYNVDGPAAERICTRARQARAAAGRLTGHAIGAIDAEPRSFAGDVLAAFAPDESRLRCDTIAARLSERLPDIYHDVTATAVASQLRSLGITVKNVREPRGEPGRGCERTAVEAVAT